MGPVQEESTLQNQTAEESFTGFVAVNERKLRLALTASLGYEVGREATADALAYGWEHWARVEAMENPIGFLYVLGRTRGRRMGRRRPIGLPQPANDNLPWIEPGLTNALQSLPERERVVVLLLHGYQFAMSEVASLLGVSKSTVQTHAERGMSKLRRRLGVDR
jgi:RNA polymerase sigma-70 factor (ECF subfamily)